MIFTDFSGSENILNLVNFSFDQNSLKGTFGNSYSFPSASRIVHFVKFDESHVVVLLEDSICFLDID